MIEAPTTTLLQTDDLAAVLSMSACERAAAAVATAMAELGDAGLATDRMASVLLKHFLVHFTGLQGEFERLIEPIQGDADLPPTRSHQPYS